MESLTKSLKFLMNEVSELKRRSSDAFTASRKYFKLPFFKRNNSKPAKSAQNTNSVFSFESWGMDNYCTFHQEKNLEKTCPNGIIT